MLRAVGVDVVSTNVSGHRVTISPKTHLDPFEFTVPADISSAAFFMVAASLFPEGMIVLDRLSTNPTRTGILDVLEQCGVQVGISEEGDEMGEPHARVEVLGPKTLRPFTIEGSLVPRLIDEIPVLAVLATQCEGTSVIHDARELRVKESDRIDLMAGGLRAMGARVETHDDGMSITGPTPLRSTRIHGKGDHRIAMAFAIAGLVADGDTEIDGAESIATSFPGFERELERLIVV
jgi:3-phosphoshikimate 1-carboxyvinyltransferase